MTAKKKYYHWELVTKNTLRLKVPDGWIVRIFSFTPNPTETSIFIADKTNKWKLDRDIWPTRDKPKKPPKK